MTVSEEVAQQFNRRVSGLFPCPIQVIEGGRSSIEFRPNSMNIVRSPEAGLQKVVRTDKHGNIVGVYNAAPFHGL